MQQKQSRFIAILSSIGAPILGSSGGACGVACVAGGCCGGPAILGLIGLSGSTLTFIEKLTPVFLVVTVVSLGYGFYNAYKPKPADCCAQTPETGTASCCATEKNTPFLQSKSFLWATTILCAIMWLYPYVSSKNSAGPGNMLNARPAGGNAVHSDSVNAGSHDNSQTDPKEGACCPEKPACETECGE